MRLELSSRSDLALRSMRALSLDERTPRSVLAEEVETTPDFLARVMAPLVARGWVESRPGVAGGYLLVVPLADVTMRDLIEAVEGPIDTGQCALRGGPCAVEQRCALHVPWTRARDALVAELESISLESA
ncbi:MAG: Rrf2 family transcriptional regulator [Acidimicrobiia bacterium]|jgi:Rrf2 family protein|nr:MAG: Rrf2 family transcriptional regulator [Acidimicrobiia bacterium]